MVEIRGQISDFFTPVKFMGRWAKCLSHDFKFSREANLRYTFAAWPPVTCYLLSCKDAAVGRIIVLCPRCHY